MSAISEKIRGYVNDPTCADNYGAWGALRPDQRAQIRALCDLCDEFERTADRLEYVLLGVMHSVDKWLEGDELEQDEVNRAATMREKLLQIIEQLETERDRYKRHYFQHNYDECRAEGIKEFAERLKEYGHPIHSLVDKLVKEMTEG